jgi:hypothetical protein
MIATPRFHPQRAFRAYTLRAEILLHHKHGSDPQGVGWMLREMGLVDYQTEYNFSFEALQTMPRTMFAMR